MTCAKTKRGVVFTYVWVWVDGWVRIYHLAYKHSGRVEGLILLEAAVELSVVLHHMSRNGLVDTLPPMPDTVPRSLPTPTPKYPCHGRRGVR